MAKKDLDKIILFDKIFDDVGLENIENPKLLTYLVGSPTWKDQNQNHKDLILPIFINVQNTNKDNIKFIKYEKNWYDLKRIRIGSNIYFNGTTTPLAAKNRNKYEISEKKLHLDNPLNNGLPMTLHEIVANYSILSKLRQDMPDDLKNEIFYVYKSDNINVIISGIEIVNFFYCKSNFKNLQKAIINPHGMEYLINEYPKLNDESIYEFEISNNAKLKDKVNLFYFAFNNTYRDLFNNVRTTFDTTGKIYAPIPTVKNIKVSAKCFIRGNDCFVLKIFDSTHFKEELTNIREPIVYHPHKLKPPKENNDGTGGSVKKETPSSLDDNDTNRTNVNSSTTNEVIIDKEEMQRTISDEDFKFTFHINEEYTGSATRKNQKNEYSEGKERTMSERPESNSTGEGVGTENSDELQDGEYSAYKGLEEILVKNDYEVQSLFGTFRSIVSKLDTKDLKKVDLYSNHNKSCFRSYKLIRISKYDITYYFFDVGEREYINRVEKIQYDKNNSILLIKSNDNLESFNENIIHNLLFNFIKSGRQWILSVNKSTKDYITLKHTGNAYTMFSRINQKFKECNEDLDPLGPSL